MFFTNEEKTCYGLGRKGKESWDAMRVEALNTIIIILLLFFQELPIRDVTQNFSLERVGEYVPWGTHRALDSEPHADPRLSAQTVGDHVSGPETPSSVLSAN